MVNVYLLDRVGGYNIDRHGMGLYILDHGFFILSFLIHFISKYEGCYECNAAEVYSTI
jgi:hypothetical protein